MTHYIPFDSITIGPRQRKKMESQPLADLETAIQQRGLLHAPTFRMVPDTDPAVWQLIVGERRTRALLSLIKKGITFFHDGVAVPPGMLPIVTLQENFSRADLKQIEYDENKLRENLLWQEEAEALAEIHRLRLEENPSQTRLDTAKQLIAENVVESTSPHSVAISIQRATAITENLFNPTIANARNATEAYNLILKGEEEAINAALARRRLAVSTTLPTITIRKGDALQILPQLESGIADLIFTDPPFGIGANEGGFRQRTVHHHNYDDTPEIAKEIYQSIILDGFRVTKPMANLFMFCDIDLFPILKQMAGRVGWVPFRTPIIWRKSMSEGMAPWQGKGFRRTYEMLFWATKGQRGLITSPVDVLDESRVSRSERTHGAEKPVELLKLLIECSTLPGDFILDPCCGSGSTLVAARDTKRTGMGIELDEVFYNTAMSNLYAEPKSNTSSIPNGGSDISVIA